MFEKLGNLKDMLSKMGDMKKLMEDAQKRIAALQVTADAGAGMVTVTASGDGQILSVKINHNLFEKEDLPMLEGLILSATNEALRRAKESAAYEMKNMSGIDFDELGKMFPGGNSPVS